MKIAGVVPSFEILFLSLCPSLLQLQRQGNTFMFCQSFGIRADFEAGVRILKLHYMLTTFLTLLWCAALSKNGLEREVVHFDINTPDRKKVTSPAL